MFRTLFRTGLRAGLAALVAGLLPSLPAAQAVVEVILREGDDLVGAGELLSFENVLVTDSGLWLVQGVAQPGGTIDLNDVVFGPAGSLPVAASGAWDVDGAGNVLHVGRNGSVRTLLWNDVPLLRTGEPVGLPGIPAGVTWTSLYAARIDDRSHVLVFALLADLSAAYVSAAVVRLDLDADGGIVSKELVVSSGDQLPTEPPESFGVFDRTGFRSFAFANASEFDEGAIGDFAWTAITTNGECLLIGLDRVVATTSQGFSAPDDPALHGRRLTSFGHRIDLNDFGSFVHTGTLDGDAETADLLIRDGEKLFQEGDVLPSLGAPLGDRTAAPVYLTNSGDVFWMAALRDTPATEATAYMRNGDVLLRSGHSVLDGQLVTELRDEENAFHVSRAGRFWIGEVVLEGTGEALALADFGLVVPLFGRGGNVGTLEHVAGEPVLGDTLTLRFGQGHVPGAATLLFFSDRAARPNSGLGIQTAYGELLVGPPRFYLAGAPWNGTPVDFVGAIPNNLALFDSTWFGQGAFLGLGQASGCLVRFTNGLRIELGAP